MIDQHDKQEIERMIADAINRIVVQDRIPPDGIKQRHLEADLIFRGEAADKPDGSTHTKAYYATDTDTLSLWDGTQWRDFMPVAISLPDYTVSNLSTDRSYDADSTTTAELADILGTLIGDLQDIGILQ